MIQSEKVRRKIQRDRYYCMRLELELGAVELMRSKFMLQSRAWWTSRVHFVKTTAKPSFGTADNQEPLFSIQ